MERAPLTLDRGRRLTCYLAQSSEQRDSVYRLRHACYLRNGSIEPRPDGRFRDGFDDSPNHFSFLMGDQGEQPLATVRISVVARRGGWDDSPARHVYGDTNIEPLNSGAFVEASRLCFATQARRDVFIGLVAHMAAMAQLHRTGWLVACPRVEHTEIYQRLFGFRALAEPRQYYGVNFRTGLLGIRLEELRGYVRGRSVLSRAWSDAFTSLRAAAIQ